MGFVSSCDQCGQSDDHPKVLVSDGGSFHHDCVNFQLKQQLVESNDKVAAIIEACEGGMKGDDLRDFILNEDTKKSTAKKKG